MCKFCTYYNKLLKKEKHGGSSERPCFSVSRFLLKLYNYLNFCSKFKIIIKYIILQKENFLNRWGTIKFPQLPYLATWAPAHHIHTLSQCWTPFFQSLFVMYPYFQESNLWADSIQKSKQLQCLEYLLKILDNIKHLAWVWILI